MSYSLMGGHVCIVPPTLHYEYDYSASVHGPSPEHLLPLCTITV